MSSPSFRSYVLFFFTNKHQLRLPPAFSTPSTILPRFFLPRFFLPRFFSIQRYSPPISIIKITKPFIHPPRIYSTPLLHPIDLPLLPYLPQHFHLPEPMFTFLPHLYLHTHYTNSHVYSKIFFYDLIQEYIIFELFFFNFIRE
jgi:hypothetical protein